ncbi:MAG: (deoxy)nucleoside triphosphate pyrophosphohydrolase [Kiritimatiellae bacterium]|nr:(deoxy)nucleoside triphosphate pyrophosphohydrolase [Kiritimatiellia bacterium]
MNGASSIVEVVGACVRRADGRVLLASRPTGKAQSGYWEFPGGKVEQGETPEQALARELREELDLAAEGFRILGSVVHEYPEKRIRLTLLACSPCTGAEPKPRENQRVAWVAPEELPRYPLCPADAELLPCLNAFC